MSLSRLRAWAVALPAAFLVGCELVRDFWLAPAVSPPSLFVTMAAVYLVGIGIFSAFVWRAVERIEAVLREAYEAAHARGEQLAALHAAALQITGERDPEAVLRQVVEASCAVIGARYGALTVIGEDGEIEHFLTTGISEEERRRLGPPPRGHGILRIVTETRRPLRVDDVPAHPRFSGFPPGHPPMRTLLAVPMLYKDRHLGNLYLSERRDGRPFTPQDEEALERFAAQAAIAIANARLYQAAQRASALEERERIAMDLHDGVIQEIYAVALALEAAAADAEERPDAARRAIEDAVGRLDRVLSDIRSYVTDLRGPFGRGESLPSLLEALLRDAGASGRLSTHLDVDGELSDVPPELRWELWHVAREAVANAVRHARASRLEVSLRREGSEVLLTVTDDGTGFGPDASRPGPAGSHHGLGNMERRMRAVGGTLKVTSQPGQGTTVAARAPLPASAEPAVRDRPGG